MEQKLQNTGSFNIPNPRAPRVYQACALFSFVAILLLYIGSIVQKREVYSGLLITEVLLVAVPSLAMLLFFRFDLKKVLRLNRISIATGAAVVFMMPLAMILSGVVNFFFLLLFKQLFGKIHVPPVPTATNLPLLLLSLIIIAGSAGICEELLFRGIIMRGFERYGRFTAIFVSAFLFGLIHMDFQKLAGVTLLGILIGYLVHRSNSIYAGMLAHFSNNAAGVLVGFVGYQIRKLQKYIGAEEMPVQETVTDIVNPFAALPQNMRLPTAIGLIISILFLTGLFAGLLFLFNHLTRERAKGQDLYVKDGEKIYPGILFLLPGIVFIGLMYASTAAFLMEINPSWLQNIFRFLFPWQS